MTDLDLDFPDPEPLTQEVKDEVRHRGPRENLDRILLGWAVY